jgi:RNA recognition motif-containing protein
MRTTLHIGNLPSHADPRHLTHLFAQCGTVTHAQVFEAEDLIQRRGGFGIVEMSSHAEAEAAITALDGADALGGAISVRWASPHERAAAHGPRLFGTMNMIDEERPTQ